MTDGSLAEEARPKLVGLGRHPNPRFQAFLQASADQPGLGPILARRTIRRLLSGIADHSPFLWGLVERDPPRLLRILQGEPQADLDRVLSDAREGCAIAEDERTVRRALRQARAHVALLVALADLGGLWSLDQVTSALSRAADTFVQGALSWLLAEARRDGKLLAESDLDATSGLVVLGLGKLGANELNYSSDIDLVVFYDRRRAHLAERVEPERFFVRLTQALARILSDRTEDGYVARVDLRLRPDPGSTPVAMPVPAALSYYETLGQNWERAAFIKARPIAGDLETGQSFLRELVPFVWRRYFDYAAIADIHAMKRQIHAVKGFAEIVVPGHDVKLGRGGIREIEFFVQTQQLIFGGRRPMMRGRRTLEMLGELCVEGWVTAEARDELTSAYVALRTVEHRLQMIADEQTQKLPSDAQALQRFARFCGFRTTEAFSTWITAHFEAVERHYSRLFEHAPGLDAEIGDLVFTGSEDDPGTIETLQKLGYKQPSVISETIRGWHFGRRPAVRSARAREVLTELVPALLQSFAKCGDPDGAIAAFDAALTRMPAATELFSILRSSAPLRVLFGDILGSAPRLAAMVTATPHVLDAVIDPAALRADVQTGVSADEVARLRAITTTEEFLDRCRLLARENQFAIGVRVLSRTVEPRDAGQAFTALATALVQATLDHVTRAFAGEHGLVPGAAIALVGLGRLGSREMTATSDLDLMAIYEAPDASALSDGRKPLPAPQYFARLTQRIIAALTAPTREGRLFEIDMRLRPWGTQGPIAVRLQAFCAYHQSEAETWERMALCRARPIAGDPDLGERIRQAIAGILVASRDAKALAADVRNMRALVAEVKGEADRQNVKTLKGGLLDIEFIAQYLVLLHSRRHSDLLEPATTDVIMRSAEAGLIGREDASVLTRAHALYSDILQMQRIALAPGTSGVPANVQHLVATAAGFPDVRMFDEAVSQQAAEVRRLYRAVLEQ